MRLLLLRVHVGVGRHGLVAGHLLQELVGEGLLRLQAIVLIGLRGILWLWLLVLTIVLVVIRVVGGLLVPVVHCEEVLGIFGSGCQLVCFNRIYNTYNCLARYSILIKDESFKLCTTILFFIDKFNRKMKFKTQIINL